MPSDHSKPSDLLFAIEKEPLPTTPSVEPRTVAPRHEASSPATFVTSLPREQLLEHVFQSMCRNRRWERELLFGAADDELALSMGHCFCLSDELNLTFQTESEPILTITYRVFNVPVTTASGPECAQYIRRTAGIPEKKSPGEQAALLAIKLDEIRDERRQDIMGYVRSLTGEKYRAGGKRKRKNSEDVDATPSVAMEIASLLFEDDCLTDSSDRRLLMTITRLLHRKAGVGLLKAAEDAINLIKRARSQWECYTPYWTGEKRSWEKAVNSATRDGPH